MGSDGRFRIVIFGGDISVAAQRQAVNALGAWLRTSLLPRYPTIKLSAATEGPHIVRFRTSQDPSIIDLLLVHAAPREEIEMITDLDEAYHPFDKQLGWEYGKVFADGPSYHHEHVQAYEKYGVGRAAGAVVAIRPDGYVGLVTSIGGEGRSEIDRWFEGVLRPVRGARDNCTR